MDPQDHSPKSGGQGEKDRAPSAGDAVFSEERSESRFQLGPLLFLTSVFFLNFISRIVLAPLMPTVEKDLGLTHGQAGSLFLLISLGYFITLLGSGFVSERLSHRKTIVVSAGLLGISLMAASFTQGLWGIRIGLLLVGMAAGLYLPSGIATLTSCTGTRHWGKAIAIHELAPNLSFVAAPLLSEVGLLWFSWRAILAILGAISLGLAILFARFGKGEDLYGKAPGLDAVRSILSEKAFWIIMVLFSLGIVGSLGVFTMLPLYLVSEHGVHRNWANTLIALSRISGLGIAFVSGWISDRLGPGRTLAAVLFLSGLSTVLLGVGPDSWIIALVFIQPAMAVCFFPPAFAALSSIGDPGVRNVAVSITVPAGFVLGGGLVPAGIGLMGDMGRFGTGMALAGGLILGGSLLALWLKRSVG